jgi:hypothetical protein
MLSGVGLGDGVSFTDDPLVFAEMNCGNSTG